MVPCIRCHRHLLSRALPCPFCAAPAAGRFGAALAVVMTPIVLAACYGMPKDFHTGDSTEPADLDADGYNDLVDCDDANAAVNPGATEDCTDGVDNDCDGKIDADDSDCATP